MYIYLHSRLLISVYACCNYDKYLCACMHACVYIDVCIWNVYLDACECMSEYVYMRVCVSVCVCLYKYYTECMIVLCVCMSDTFHLNLLDLYNYVYTVLV